ncbi:barstar family protein [Streptomyces sp. NBC_00454]|uniref:barstar family protein n=1 Tax=Streptomyces sp. NBC_00454 TaxID=2975747 RepID=UPI0030E09CAF
MPNNKWEMLRSAPADTQDPYVISARERLARWEDLPMSKFDVGDRPYLISEAECRKVLDGLAGAGVSILEADASGVLSEDDFLVLLGRVYGFPEYYGENWDAFLDCFADVVEADSAPIVLVISGLSSFFESDFRSFLRCLHELESVTESIPLFRSVIPRKVVNLYPGHWPVPAPSAAG